MYPIGRVSIVLDTGVLIRNDLDELFERQMYEIAMSIGTGITHCEHKILEVLVIQTGIGVQDAAMRRRVCGNVTAAAAAVFAEVSRLRQRGEAYEAEMSRWGIADAPMTCRGCGSVSARAAMAFDVVSIGVCI